MSLYEFVDELGRTIRSGRLRAVGGTVGDVPTQQADHSLSQSPGGGSQTGMRPIDVLFNEPDSPTLYAITAVDTDAGSFGIAGDHTAAFPVGCVFAVNGSTGNDTVYRVSAVSFATGTTTIVVDPVPHDPTVDGDVVRPLLARVTLDPGLTLLDVFLYPLVGPWADAGGAAFDLGDSTGHQLWNEESAPPAYTSYDPLAFNSGVNFANYGEAGTGAYVGVQIFGGSTFGNPGGGIPYDAGSDIMISMAGVITGGGGGQLLVRLWVCGPTDPTIAT